ncbi:MAG: hypothetical protein QOG23_1373 [Blastocatellia bacterium]|nr:hypothetical protein [Blastocatellia bacterium]
MKRRLFPLTLFFVLLLSALTAYGQTCGVHCGTERWAVKTLTDTTVGNIDQTEVVRTINWVRTRTTPGSLPNTTRLIGVETMTLKITGVVLFFKKETNDNDFHVVIAQVNNHARTMIIEFPDSQCDHVCSSGFRQQIDQARADFIAAFGQPTTSFKSPPHPVKVEVVGIGFFDRPHGQRGRALPSGIEMHPVLKFRVIE